MDESLRSCAVSGDLEALYTILRDDPTALDRLEPIQFIDTPLHIAAGAGNTSFAMEIATLKPSFASKLNPQLLSPMHLALQNGHDQVVFGLLRKVGSDLILVKGKGSFTPLHYVAQMDNVDMLAEFLRLCPSSVKEVTVELETAVHVAAKHGCVGSVKVLLGWLEQAGMKYILEWPDVNGDSAIHVATADNQPQVMKLLIQKMDVNYKNKVNQMTAMDTFELHRDSLDREVGATLARAEAKKASELRDVGYFSRRWLSFFFIPIIYGNYLRRQISSSEIRSAILVVAVLIATATYQAVLSPPGGYWQSDTDSSGNMTKGSNHTNTNQRVAGTVILDDSAFYLYNSIAFFTAELTIFTAIPEQLPLPVLHLSNAFFVCSYDLALIAILRSGQTNLIIGALISILGAVALFFYGMIVGYDIRKFKTRNGLKNVF